MANLSNIIISPEPYRVYQRSASNTAIIDVVVDARNECYQKLEARLSSKKGESIAGFGWQTLEPKQNTFCGTLNDVPVGGPYSVQICLKDCRDQISTHTIPGILVGDLWVLAGQSNMEGCGKLINLERPSEHVNALYFGDYWNVAKDPLCWFDEATEPVHWSTPDPVEREEAAKRDRAFRDFGGGLGVRFGKEIHKATGVPVGLVMCPHGGSSLAQWNPKLKHLGPNSFYGCMLRRIELAGGKVTGCLWYQGEADALEGLADTYKANTEELVESLRLDLAQPDLPFLYVQLSRFHSWDPSVNRPAWNQVQHEQLILENEIESAAMAAAIDCTLTDPIHLDSVSQRRMGVRLAKLARKIVFGEHIETGPRPSAIELDEKSPRRIAIRFDGVNGVLTPAREIRGFSVEKDEKPIAIKTCVRGRDGKSVVITLAEDVPDGARLWYGRGIFPVVNLADKEDFTAPVFGPVAL